MYRSVLDILEETTQNYPQKIACIDPKEQISYQQLKQDARLIGYVLNEKTNATAKPIVLFIEKSCKCLIAMMGTLYSGNIYVPMDVKTPLERLNSILETLETDIIITTEADKRHLTKMGYEGECLVYESLMEQAKIANPTLVDEKLAHIANRVLDTDIMYILFTSGSTGIPKGVAIRHRSVIDYIDAYVNEVGIDESDVVGNQAPFYNDMTVRDLFMPLKVGGAVCIIPQNLFMSPKRVLQYMEENGVTYVCWAPTAYNIIYQFDGLSKNAPSKIRKILYSGEVMPIPVLQYWRDSYPNAEYFQCYGPTEITGACIYNKVDRDYSPMEKIPMGQAFNNTGVMLLDEADNLILPTNANKAGEICVYGTCLAAGYYNNPEKTKEAFVQNPLITQYDSLMYRTGDLAYYDEDANLIFMSRKDYQVKHSGRRIELGEIEAAMISLEEVKTCCCVHKRDTDELVLYYVGDIDSAALTIGVKDKLPKYMIPTVFRQQESLPLLANGKLNRKQMDAWENQA